MAMQNYEYQSTVGEGELGDGCEHSRGRARASAHSPRMPAWQDTSACKQSRETAARPAEWFQGIKQAIRFGRCAYGRPTLALRQFRRDRIRRALEMSTREAESTRRLSPPFISAPNAARTGAYGYVWRCKDKTTGEMVAVKGFKQAHEDPEVSAGCGQLPNTLALHFVTGPSPAPSCGVAQRTSSEPVYK